jgi:hypothetical protein
MQTAYSRAPINSKPYLPSSKVSLLFILKRPFNRLLVDYGEGLGGLS